MRVCQFRHDRVPFGESVFIELMRPAFKGSVSAHKAADGIGGAISRTL
jgi:hypothetical protein